MSDQILKVIGPQERMFRDDIRAGFRRGCVWLVQLGVIVCGLVIGARLLAILMTALAGDPQQIRQGAQAGADANAYLGQVIKAGILPEPKDIATWPKPVPSPSPSSEAKK